LFHRYCACDDKNTRSETSDYVEPISLVFPRRLVQKARQLPTRIYNDRAHHSASGVVSQALNGCAAQDWGQLLTFQGKSGSHFGAFTTSRSLCTKAKKDPRELTLRPCQEHLALQTARREQQTEAFKEEYAKRAGIEGTISQAVRAFELRRSRYLGLAKTHLQHLLTAIAINLVRFDAWLNEVPHAKTRTSRFAALAVANAR
jgi:hypothetical protein